MIGPMFLKIGSLDRKATVLDDRFPSDLRRALESALMLLVGTILT